jgi:hypothetical protein
MTPTRPSPEGAEVVRPDDEPYRSRGPFLVVHADDPIAVAVADLVVKACADRTVDVDQRTIDNVSTVRLERYPLLVVILPTVPEVPISEHLRRFVELLSLFRAMRQPGLRDLLERRCRWHEAGVIHLAGRRGVVNHRTIEHAVSLNRVCVIHHLNESGHASVDVFHGFSARPLHPRRGSPAAKNEEIRRAMTWIREWGADVSDVPGLRSCIDECRDHFENPRFPALYRPVSSLPHNRLSFILDGIAHEPTPQQRKTWTENGARVTRFTIARMKKIVPSLQRPVGGVKGAQADLRSFYIHVLVVDAYMKLVPEQDRPTF